MPLKTVFIDVGGTLIEENPSRAAIYAAVAAARGRRVSPDDMARHMRVAHDALPVVVGGCYRYSDPWFEAFMEHVFSRDLGLGAELLPGIAAELFERFSDPATFRVFPGALEFLDDLDALGIGAAAVSNWSGRLEALLARLGIAERLRAVVASADERCEKPSAELFRRALERTGTSAPDALHAGDNPERDLAGARAAGIEAVLVDHHGAWRDLATARVTSFAELGAFVRERAA